MNIITSDFLRAKDACVKQLALFERTFPRGADLRRPHTLSRAKAAGLDLAWAGKHLLSDSALAEYERMCAAAWAEYERMCAAAWAEYVRMCAAAWVEYVRVRDAAWVEYWRVRDTALVAALLSM